MTVLGKATGFDAHTEGVLSTPAGYLARADTFSGITSHKGAELSLILFPTREAGRTPELRQLSGAEAGLRLMSTLVNARNLPRHGLGEITRLARSVPAFEVRYGDCGQVAEQLEALISEYAS